MIQTTIYYAVLGAVTGVLARWRDSLGAVSSWGMIGVYIGMAFGAIFGVVGVLIESATGIYSRWRLEIFAWRGIAGGVSLACDWAMFASFLGALFGSAGQNAVIPVLDGPVSMGILFGLLAMASSALGRLSRIVERRWRSEGVTRVADLPTDLQALAKDLTTHCNTQQMSVGLMNEVVLTIVFFDSPFHGDEKYARDVAIYAGCHYARVNQLAAIVVLFDRRRSLIFGSFTSYRCFQFPIHNSPGPGFVSLTGGARAEPDARNQSDSMFIELRPTGESKKADEKNSVSAGEEDDPSRGENETAGG